MQILGKKKCSVNIYFSQQRCLLHQSSILIGMRLKHIDDLRLEHVCFRYNGEELSLSVPHTHVRSKQVQILRIDIPASNYSVKLKFNT